MSLKVGPMPLEEEEMPGEESLVGEPLKQETRKLVDEFYGVVAPKEPSPPKPSRKGKEKAGSIPAQKDEKLPPPRARSQWQDDNKRGFFLGLIEHGEETHIQRLYELLKDLDDAKRKTFNEQQTFTKLTEVGVSDASPTFIDEMFAYYILLYHRSYSGAASCHTPSEAEASSQSPSQLSESAVGRGSAEESSVGEAGEEFVGESSTMAGTKRGSSGGAVRVSKKAKKTKSTGDSRKQLAKARLERKMHCLLKESLLEKDKGCLFCWKMLKRKLHAAHIIAQKEAGVFVDEKEILEKAGLTSKHQPQNGLLLCSDCHESFDYLLVYVDEIGDRLVIQCAVPDLTDVDDTNASEKENAMIWKAVMKNMKSNMKSTREDFQHLFSDGRLLEETEGEAKGEMALYFADRDRSTYPSKAALRFHKRACLIWRMAGGAEEPDDSCPDDDEDIDPVCSKSKDISKWLDSTAQICVGEVQWQ